MLYFFITERTSEMSSLVPVSILAIATPSMSYSMSCCRGASACLTTIRLQFWMYRSVSFSDGGA